MTNEELNRLEELEAEVAALREQLERLARPFFREEGATIEDENVRLRAEIATLQLRWNTGVPEVPDGCMWHFWCAVRYDAGIVHRSLCYANRYVMPCADWAEPPKGLQPVDEDGEKYYWIGWLELSCDHCETQWLFDGEVVAWMRMPKYQDAAPGKGGGP